MQQNEDSESIVPSKETVEEGFRLGALGPKAFACSEHGQELMLLYGQRYNRYMLTRSPAHFAEMKTTADALLSYIGQLEALLPPSIVEGVQAGDIYQSERKAESK